MTWATPTDVKNITGQTVTEPNIAEAIGVIELKTGLLVDQTPNLSGRDGAYLRRAVAYQTVWQMDNPDVFVRLDVSSTGQDGQSANYRADALVLAPLAKLALKRLSWKGTRSTSHERAGADVADDELDAYGRPLPWRKL